MPLGTPASTEAAHQDLLHLLVQVQNLRGRTGSLAERIAKDLRLHMEKEEELALPLLGILPDLASGKLGAGPARRASKLYTRLKEEYPRMVQEHKALGRSLNQLRRIGNQEGHLTAVRFAEILEQHSHEEDEILYPAAVLAGRLASAKVKSSK